MLQVDRNFRDATFIPSGHTNIMESRKHENLKGEHDG
jgi:hypothetical protein